MQERDIHKQAVKALEEHGHLFQQRCLAEIELQAPGYEIVSEEYPTSVEQENTVIDFVLTNMRGPKFYLVFECKRAHPNYVTWVFGAPKQLHAGVPKFIGTKLEKRASRPHPATLLSPQVIKAAYLDLCRLEPKLFVPAGLEVRNRPGKGKSGRTDTIFFACQQVLTGVGGLAFEQRNRDYELQPGVQHFPQYFVPIVVTTANLFVTEYSTWNVELATGHLPVNKAATRSADWVFLDFPVRDRLQVTWPEDAPEHAYFAPTEDYRKRFKTKSVAIVQADSLIRFLNQLNLVGDL